LVVYTLGRSETGSQIKAGAFDAPASAFGWTGVYS
jgi:hypothetical protein